MKASQLKAIAKQRIAGNSGTLIGASLIYFAILFALFFVILFVYTAHVISQGAFASTEAFETYLKGIAEAPNSELFLSDVISILFGALVQTLTVGFYYLCLNAARLKQPKISDLFYAYKRNPDRVILIALIQSGASYLCMLIPTLIGRFGNLKNYGILSVYYILYVIGNVLSTIVVILLSQSMFLYIDNPDENVINCVRVSVMIMKNNIWRYFCLSISFIGWFLLVPVTCGVAIVFLMPYMYVTFALFYMQLKGELGSSVDVTIHDGM